MSITSKGKRTGEEHQISLNSADYRSLQTQYLV
jgi:hypothetical protein